MVSIIMKKLSVIGHFGFGKNLLNGQTIKTKILTDELARIYGEKQIRRYDTHGGWRYLIKMPFALWHALASSQAVIMMPAYKGIRLITPFLYAYNKLFHRQLIYIVIGGWLPKMLHSSKYLRSMLRHWNHVLVETECMKEELELMGLDNITVMPNCKRLSIIDHPAYHEKQFRLCTFSRVMKEKGIEDAVNAVCLANKALGHEAFTLDIYGQIDARQQQWFEQICERFPSYIHYKGCIDYNDSVSVLSKHFALLFPTQFPTEGFAGTILDAFASGLPVLATDCRSNQLIISEGHTGFLFPVKSPKAISQLLINIAHDPAIVEKMRNECTAEARKYQPEVVIRTLTLLIDGYQRLS